MSNNRSSKFLKIRAVIIDITIAIVIVIITIFTSNIFINKRIKNVSEKIVTIGNQNEEILENKQEEIN